MGEQLGRIEQAHERGPARFAIQPEICRSGRGIGERRVADGPRTICRELNQVNWKGALRFDLEDQNALSEVETSDQ